MKLVVFVKLKKKGSRKYVEGGGKIKKSLSVVFHILLHVQYELVSFQ